jgi:hypothetical protein
VTQAYWITKAQHILETFTLIRLDFCSDHSIKIATLENKYGDVGDVVIG